MEALEPYRTHVGPAAERYGLQPSWLEAVLIVESAGGRNDVPRYESHIQDASVGVGQVLTSTAVWMAREGHIHHTPTRFKVLFAAQRCLNDGCRPLFRVLEDPQVAVELAAAYLGYQMRRYGDIEDAVAAYNAGSVRLREDGSYVNQWHVNKWSDSLDGLVLS